MTTDEEARLIGGKLTKATDGLTTTLAGIFHLAPEQSAALSGALSGWAIAILERVTDRAVGKVIEQYRLVERVEALEAREAGGE